MSLLENYAYGWGEYKEMTPNKESDQNNANARARTTTVNMHNILHALWFYKG
jgi:hypothetical protein